MRYSGTRSALGSLTALAADLVSLRKQPLLALFSSEQEHFISTITPGSEDEYTG